MTVPLGCLALAARKSDAAVTQKAKMPVDFEPHILVREPLGVWARRPPSPSRTQGVALMEVSMQTVVLVVLAVVILLLVVLGVLAQRLWELRTVEVPDKAILEADGPVLAPLAVVELPPVVARLVEGYCLREREMVEMVNPQPVALRNGKLATVGVCPHCGTTICKIEKSPALIKHRARVPDDRERVRHRHREMA
jgi:uncharacterized protein DUF5679